MGILSAALSRFTRGELSIDLPTFKALARDLGLRVVSAKRKAGK
jgi:hypothetical protein